jgi:hypothetical protein
MWVNKNQTSTQVYAKLAVSYEQLDKLEREQNQSNAKKDRFDISGLNEVDENDYQRVLSKFKSTDAKIRTHEQSHAMKSETTAPIQYNYQMGPDGKMYAVGGSVRLDTSIPLNDPKAASFKLDKLKNSATAPDQMSGADSSIAIQANLMKMRLSLENN